jgi:hypothetical protein
MVFCVFDPMSLEPLESVVTPAGWFIGMMCAISFLLLVLFLACCLKRSRGQQYPGEITQLISKITHSGVPTCQLFHT